MPAVGVAALADQGAHLREAAGQLPGLDSPETDLAETRGVDQVAPGVERQHHGGDGGVLPTPDPGTDLADPELESRLNRIEQTRLARARWPGHHRDPSPKRLGKLLDSLA